MSFTSRGLSSSRRCLPSAWFDFAVGDVLLSSACLVEALLRCSFCTYGQYPTCGPQVLECSGVSRVWFPAWSVVQDRDSHRVPLDQGLAI